MSDRSCFAVGHFNRHEPESPVSVLSALVKPQMTGPWNGRRGRPYLSIGVEGGRTMTKTIHDAAP